MVQERSKPYDEQFPYVRYDVDTITKNVDKLTTNVNKLCQYNSRRSKDLEDAVNLLFETWLAKKNWHSDKIPLEKGNIYHLVDGKKQVLVQWDGIYSAERVNEKGEKEKNLFFIETKESSHLTFIQDDKMSLYKKGEKTFQYLKTLWENENLNEPSLQDFNLFHFKNYSLIVVYATGGISEDIRTCLLNVQQTYKMENIPIVLMKASCPRISSFFMEELDNLDTEELEVDFVSLDLQK